MTDYRIRRGLVGLVAVLSAAAVWAAPASAGGVVTTPALTPGSTYLALGDSVTFGYVESKVVPAPNYHNAAGFLGYPEHLARELGIKVVNAACPGESSASLVSAKAQSNGCENTLAGPGGYRTLFPLHVKYTGSQLGFAVHYLRTHKKVRLVSLMIGANDGFLCQESTADHCTSLSEQKALLARISANVTTILKAIRHRAHYHGQIVIVNYYSLNYASPAQNRLSTALNVTQDNAGKPFGVEIADGYGEFKAQATPFGGDVCQAGLINSWGTPRCPTTAVHPTYAGQALLAEAVLDAIRL